MPRKFDVPFEKTAFSEEMIDDAHVRSIILKYLKREQLLI